LRAAARALGDTGVEAGWLRGAADLAERDEAERHSVRAEAVWLEELSSEARARKASLLSAWVDAAEALRTAIHALESERGPLVESLFPVWRGPSLRRHADQARTAETELQRRLTSGYVVRRLAELATHSALGAALEALAGAGAAWAAERDRPVPSGAEADAVRTRLLALAGRTTRLLERVRWVARAALADRPELIDEVFPKRGRAPGATDSSATGVPAPAGDSAPAEDVAATEPAADARAEAAAPSTSRSSAPRRTATKRGESPRSTTSAGPAEDARVSGDSAAADTTTRRKERTTRPASGPKRNVPAPHATAPGRSPERTSTTGKAVRSGRSTPRAAAPAPGAAPSSRSTSAPEPATAGVAPGSQKARPPSPRGSGRRTRPPRRS
jgi:hypothetical protein